MLLASVFNCINYLVRLKICRPLIVFLYVAIILNSLSRISTGIYHMMYPEASLYESLPYRYLRTSNCITQQGIYICVIMTLFQLTISLCLICEDFYVEGARMRKKLYIWWGVMFYIAYIGVMLPAGLFDID